MKQAFLSLAYTTRFNDIPIITPHRFRHTLATNLMRSPDRNVTLVKELLGHSSITTTLEYIVTDQTQLRDCLNDYFQDNN